VTVIELGEGVAVPYAGKLLAELGADVIKVETRSGDISRQVGPFPLDEPSQERSGMFAYLNCRKLGVVVDDNVTATGAATATGISAPDVLLVDESFLGSELYTSTERLLDIYPSAVIVTVTPFGTTGPRAGLRGYNLSAAASGGTAYGVGEAARSPLALPYFQDLHQSGICAAIAAMMGLIGRSKDTVRQHVDISVQEIMASLHCGYFLPRFIFEGGVTGRRAGRDGGAMLYPNTVMVCKDGLVSIVAPKLDQWKRFLHLLGDPEWAEEPRYRDRRAMQWEYKEEVDALIAPWFLKHTKKELLEVFHDARLPFAPILGPQEIIDSVHLQQRDAFRQCEFPADGTFLAPAAPYIFSRSHLDFGRAPLLGEHNGSAQLAALCSRSNAQDDQGLVRDLPNGPLTGLRVLDLGTAWAGGIAGRLLGDYGADVIKVESVSHLDGSRMGRPIIVDDATGGDRGNWPDLQPGFHVHGRNKRSLTLNLRNEHGMEVLLRLVERSDILLHNFPSPVVDSLGLDANRLQSVNPRLIIVGQSVAGNEGQLSGYTGYANTVAALGGLLGGIGYEGEEPIAMYEGIYCDVVSAQSTVVAALAGLIERTFSGLGQSIDVSQWEATLALTAEALIDYSINGRQQRSMGHRHPLFAPHGIYRCVDGEEDEWLSLVIASDEQWADLLDIAKLGERLPGAETWTQSARREQRGNIDEALEEWLASKDANSTAEELQTLGIAAFRVLNIADIFADEQLMHRRTFIELEHPLVGLEPMPGLAWRFSASAQKVFTSAPLLGGDSRSVLREFLNVDDSEYDDLVAVGAVETPVPPSSVH
jgi:crotonobetainyl-CoA:carnitine CoA-transferase CaiB-like acyl-CoA transferase